MQLPVKNIANLTKRFSSDSNLKMQGLILDSALLFWPRAPLKGPGWSFVIVVVGVETWAKNALRKWNKKCSRTKCVPSWLKFILNRTKKFRKQNLLQIEQKLLHKEQKCSRMKIVFKVIRSLLNVFLVAFPVQDWPYAT